MPSPEPVRVGFVSLGCSKNLVDTEVMLGGLSNSGFALSADVPDCDVIVVNTCGFIDPARRESVNTILEMADAPEPGNDPLDPHAEAGMGHGAVLPDLQVPPESLFGEAVLPDA